MRYFVLLAHWSHHCTKKITISLCGKKTVILSTKNTYNTCNSSESTPGKKIIYNLLYILDMTFSINVRAHHTVSWIALSLAAQIMHFICR